MDDLDNSPKQVDRFSVVAAVLRLDQIGNLLEMLGKGRPSTVARHGKNLAVKTGLEEDNQSNGYGGSP